MTRSDQPAADPIDPRIEDVLRYAIAIGATLLLLLPAARGSSELLGWLPLWLLAMPLSAWWALHRFRLLAAPSEPRSNATHRRRTGPQARRRARPSTRPALRNPQNLTPIARMPHTQIRKVRPRDFVHATRMPPPC